MAGPLALTITIAVVICGCFATDYGWQPRKEFVFSVEGQDVVGLPQLKSQYAGFQYQGELRVQTHSARVFQLKFFNMSYTKIQGDLSQGWWRGPEARLKKKTKQLPITTSTILVTMYRSGKTLRIQPGLDDWQVNFIKGIISHLMVYINDNSATGHFNNEFSDKQDSDVYSVIEDSVSGRCEVMYEKSPLPRQLAPPNQHLCGPEAQLWEITKTRNFSNCQELTEDHAHLPSSNCPPGGSNCGQFWTRASLTQMIGCGKMDNLVLLSSVSSSVNSAALHLKNTTQAVANSKLNITLTSVFGIKTKFNSPTNATSIRDLLYLNSMTPKESFSQVCQDTLRNSEDDDDSREHVDFTKQMNPTKEEGKKNVDGMEPSKTGVRNRRSLKYKRNKYQTNSNEQQSNENSDEQQSYKKKSNKFNPGRSESKKHGYKGKYGNDDGTSNESNQFVSAEKNYPPQRKPNKNQRSKEFYDQNSAESNSQYSDQVDSDETWKTTTKEIPSHRPFNLFTLAHRTSNDVSCLTSRLRQIIGDIASDLQEMNSLPENNTMEKLSIAVDMCRLLPFDQLNMISEEIFETHNGDSNTTNSDERNVFRDVMAMCGSHPAFRIIKGWVEGEKIQGEEAAQIISSLPNHILSPNENLIQDFFDMVQSISEKENKQLTITAVLSFSNLVRSACVNEGSRKHQFNSDIRPKCDEAYVTKYKEWLEHKISSDAPLRRAYIEALGSMGSTTVVNILKSIALNPKYSSYYRTSAVFAMRYQALRKNPEMAAMLMSLYHNYSLPASVRIASAGLLMYTDPGLGIWQRLAISTWYEPSSAVAQYISSSLRNMARFKDSIYGKMAKAAALVQPLARPSKIFTNRPFNLMTSWLSYDLEKIIIEQISWMQFSDFSNFYYRHSSRYSGFSRTNVAASFSVSNPDELWGALQELIAPTDDRSTKYPNLGASHSIADIQEKLGLNPYMMPSLQAELHFKVNNNMERMFLINRDTIQSLAKGGPKLISELLRQGKKFTYQKADMDDFHISTTTEMGFPVEFSVRTPWTVRANAGLNTTKEGLAVELAFMYSAQLLSSMSVLSPWDDVAHMAGAYATNFVQLPPLRLVSSIASDSDSVKMTTNYIDQHRLLYFNMQPFTSQRKIKVYQPVLLSSDTVPIKLGDSVQMPISGMGRFLNNVYSSERSEHFNAMDLFKQTRGVVGFPLVFTNMESRSFETIMNPLHPVTMNFSMSMASKAMGALEYISPKENFISRLIYSMEKVLSLGQSRVMAAFKLFGLFGGDEEPSTTANPSGNKNDNSQTNKQNSDNNPTQAETPGDKKDSDGTSSKNNDPKSQVSTGREQVGKVAPTTQVYTTTYESAVGNFNASLVDPFSNSAAGNGDTYLLDQALSKINSGSAVVYAFDITSAVPEKPVHISAYVTYASTYSGRVNRFGLFVKKDETQTKLTAVHEYPADISSDLKRRVAEDLHHNIFLDYIHSASNQDFKVFMKAGLAVSRTELEVLRNSPLLDTCSQGDAAIEFQCQQLREQSQQISFGNITVYYSDDAKYLEKMVTNYVNAAKVIIPGTEEKSAEGHNTVRMLLNVDQRTRAIDMLVTTPTASAKVHRLAMSKLPMPILAEWATQPDAVTEYCGVSPKRFRTFDGGESFYDMKDGWHLVLHDRTRKYGISIMAQSSNNNTMKIEVNKDDQTVIRVEEGPKIYVNDQLQQLDVGHSVMVVTDGQGRVAMHTTYTPDSSLRIQLPNEQLDLKYTMSSLVVRAGQALHGRLCGICGSYSNSGAEQYLTASGRSAKSAAEFVASFHLGASTSSQSGANN